jgi:hypothetical protein
MRPYILFIVVLAGGVAITAAISNILDSRIDAQELRREQNYQAAKP